MKSDEPIDCRIEFMKENTICLLSKQTVGGRCPPPLRDAVPEPCKPLKKLDLNSDFYYFSMAFSI